MLTDRYRLRRRRDFKYVYARGKSFVHPMMVLYVRRGNPDAPTHIRIGFSVSKKLGGAVERNRIKRRLREAFKSHASQLVGSADLIVVGRSRLIETDFQLQCAALGGLLKQAGLIAPTDAVGDNECEASEQA